MSGFSPVAFAATDPVNASDRLGTVLDRSWTFTIRALTLVGCYGCSGGSPPRERQQLTARCDSAGVEIVQNGAEQSPAAWIIEPVPRLSIGEYGLTAFAIVLVGTVGAMNAMKFMPRRPR